ncbi:MAG: hypothetical protein P1P64_07815 [Treponemataceae bacterium]
MGDVENKIIELDSFTRAGLQKVPIDFFEGDYLSKIYEEALVLCVDMRGFSNFLSSNKESIVFKLLTQFTSNLLSCINQVGYGCSYYKLLGDGALVIWDEASDAHLAEAVNVFRTYSEFLDEELFDEYPELGFSGALVLEKIFKYEISAEASQLKYRDYVGYGLNLACRLENVGKKHQLIVNKVLAESGKITFKKDTSEKARNSLNLLKGLHDEDREAIYLFESLI